MFITTMKKLRMYYAGTGILPPMNFEKRPPTMLIKRWNSWVCWGIYGAMLPWKKWCNLVNFKVYLVLNFKVKIVWKDQCSWKDYEKSCNYVTWYIINTVFCLRRKQYNENKQYNYVTNIFWIIITHINKTTTVNYLYIDKNCITYKKNLSLLHLKRFKESYRLYIRGGWFSC